MVYRLADIQFDQLVYSPAYSTQSVNLANRDMTRHEVLLFQRFGFGEQQRWQIQLTGGLSVDGQARNTGTVPDNTYQENRTGRPVLLASAGVVFKPTLLRKKQPVQP
ncbi:hypothetical protein [Hymenobacter cellulosilyticus]|uniref:Uncharacterized protein n=1 Tax=Hymenobacter cellulosilyticus TaxID=2932248 RepID=A0A8T9QF77_9BACT|nr:hypothetical protein [Hymenobacter cellulosilyticus]UOQ74209.1 hypothetical protein MUN79_10150 [Hymenobacter cellulosilyticus]